MTFQQDLKTTPPETSPQPMSVPPKASKAKKKSSTPPAVSLEENLEAIPLKQGRQWPDEHRYSEKLSERILHEEALFGLSIDKIAEKLNVSKMSLYRWAKTKPELCYALTRAKQRYMCKMIGWFEEFKVTSKGEKFSGNELLGLLKIMGYGREVPHLSEEADELRAIQIIQNALSEGSIEPSYAETCLRVILAKLDVKKDLDLAKRLEALEAKLNPLS